MIKYKYNFDDSLTVTVNAKFAGVITSLLALLSINHAYAANLTTATLSNKASINLSAGSPMIRCSLVTHTNYCNHNNDNPNNQSACFMVQNYIYNNHLAITVQYTTNNSVVNLSCPQPEQPSTGNSAMVEILNISSAKDFYQNAHPTLTVSALRQIYPSTEYYTGSLPLTAQIQNQLINCELNADASGINCAALSDD